MTRAQDNAYGASATFRATHDSSATEGPDPVWYRRSVYGLMALAMVLRLIYMLYTHRVWEDALITVQHSEDFVRGMGLTHPVPPGEGPLHGFTSPLSVLIPLMGDLVHLGFGITFLKIVSIFAGAAAVWLGTRIARTMHLPYALALAAGGFLAVEHHQILWGMAGMETEVVTAIYLWVLYALFNGGQWQKGFALGFAMLARPDAGFLVVIAFVAELLRVRRSRDWKSLVPVAAGLTLLYAPWLIFTTIYYGSPVPNTILAKGFGYPTVVRQLDGLRLLSEFSNVLFYRFIPIFASMGPSYAGHGSGFQSLRDYGIVSGIMLAMILVGTVVACVRRDLPAMVLFAFVLLYSVYLTLAANFIFGWYTVPIVAAGVIGAFYGLDSLIRKFLPPSTWRPAGITLGALYVLMLAACLPMTFRSDKYVQANIEDGVRKTMGLWLRDVSLPTDTISSESLGYVGYYSGRVIYDYPGLCSRKVVAYFRSHPDERGKMSSMMRDLQPTYIVLRPREYKGKPDFDWLPQRYDLVRTFQASPETDKLILRSNGNIDRVFDVYRLKGAPFRQTN